MEFSHENASRCQADDSVANVEIMERPQAATEPISTDLLLSLPPELLLPIFELVGVENFRKDVRRLAVCKKWYVYAQPILLGNLRLRSTDLRPMLRAMRKDASLAAAQKMTKQIHLTIVTVTFYTYPNVSRLEQIVSRLKVFDALRTLVVRSRGGTLPMSSQLFSSFTSIHQLTSLEMDLDNILFGNEATHLCDSISRLIPTLKSLRCRLPRICNNLLESPPGDLKELIIVIYPLQFRRADTCHCSTGSTLNDDSHRAALEARLADFAASMSNPKTVRLVHRFQNLYETYAFDAIRKRRFFLGHDSAWDANGVLLPEDWEDWKDREDNGEDEERDEE